MLVVVVLGIFLAVTVHTLDNGLARTPPMGWMTWERFRCNTDCYNDPNNCISEKLIMQMADRMAEDGYLAAGYEYVSIDDCWMSKKRDSEGRLQPDPDRFPSGIKALADYVHSRGLKLGIYGDVGPLTCQLYPGNRGYYELDAQTYASWGVDMLKFDCCYGGGGQEADYRDMGYYLNKTGRPIMYSCAFPLCLSETVDFTHAANLCNTWFLAPNVQDSWSSVFTVIEFYRANKRNFTEVAGPGNWNDADELVAGDFGLSFLQQMAQMGMWAIMASPLFMSVDLRTISPDAKELLLNERVLAINQDPLGVQGRFVWEDKSLLNMQGWLRRLTGDRYAIGILNVSGDGSPLLVNKTMMDLGLPPSYSGYTLTEVFSGKQYGHFSINDRLTVPIPPTTLFLAVASPSS